MTETTSAATLPEPTDGPLGGARLLIAFWAVGGVALLLTQAIVRLAPLAWAPIRDGALHGWLWVALAGSVAFNGFFEGYQAFHKGFGPRVAARGLHVARRPRVLHVVLAPLFSMGYFHATRKRKITSWSVTTGVIVLIVLVHQVPQPWRGIIDAGVVVGLAWGVFAVLSNFVRYLRGAPAGPLDLPAPAAAEAPGLSRAA